MGYLSQKKRQIAIHKLLAFSLLFLTLCCVLLLFCKTSFLSVLISQWLFQLYLYTLLMIVCALFYHFWKYAIGLSLVAFLFFLLIGIGTNLFFDVKSDGLQTVRIFYQPYASHFHESDKQISRSQADIAALITPPNIEINHILSDMPFPLLSEDGHLIMTPHKVSSSGELKLSPHSRAGFVELIINTTPLVFISLNFSAISTREQKIALKNLADFINMQDTPVIVVGNFGQTAWSVDFSHFLEKTGLEVKNRVLLSNGKKRFNLFSIPTLNILAYHDFGIRDISFLSTKNNPTHPLLIELSY